MIALVFTFGFVSQTIIQTPLYVTLAVQTVLVFIAFVTGAAYPVLSNRNRFADVLSMRGAPPVFFVVAIVGVLFAGALCDEAASLLHRWKPDFFSLGTMKEIADTMTTVGPVGFVVLTVALSLFPAVGEEVMFRGLVLRSFRRDMPIHFAVIYSSILFGLVHFSWLQGTAAALLGCFLGVLVIFSGSIYPAMVAHLVNNISWCLLSRYEPTFMADVLSEGHSWQVLGVCTLVVSASVALMWKFRVPRHH